MPSQNSEYLWQDLYNPDGSCHHCLKGWKEDEIPCSTRKSSIFRASLVAQRVKNLLATQETQVQSLGWEDSLDKGMATHSVVWRGDFHGQRSLVGYSPWGCKELDTTERLTL